MDLTVAICTRNRRSSLLQTLDSMGAQRAELSWEILVVDNGSSDGTAAAVEQRAALFPAPLRVIPAAEPGLSFARNAALEQAGSGLILFLDDDLNCRPGLLHAHWSALQDPAVAASGGRILPLLPPETPDWFRRIVGQEVGGPSTHYDFGPQPCLIPPQGPQPAPFGANMAMRRDRARRLGGFRTDLGWGRRRIPGEETEFFQRLWADGGQIAYAPEAVVEHRLQPYQVTEAYYRQWYEGYGRATVLMEPSRTLPARVRAAAAAWRLSRRQFRHMRRRLRRGDAEKGYEAARRGAVAAGQWRQWLGL